VAFGVALITITIEHYAMLDKSPQANLYHKWSIRDSNP
jgi:hypothetical protein